MEWNKSLLLNYHSFLFRKVPPQDEDYHGDRESISRSTLDDEAAKKMRKKAEHDARRKLVSCYI